MTHTAKIRAKGLDATGVTEDIARSMAGRLGAHTLMIVEVNHSAVTTTDDGDTQVALNITTCEPVPTSLEDTVRDLQRALYRQRPEVQGQSALTGVDDGLSPEDAAAAVGAHIERTDDGEVSGVWSGDPDPDALNPETGATNGVTGSGTPEDGPEGAPAATRPLSSVPSPFDTPTKATEPPGGVPCPFPDCSRPEGHPGKHNTKAAQV